MRRLDVWSCHLHAALLAGCLGALASPCHPETLNVWHEPLAPPFPESGTVTVTLRGEFEGTVKIKYAAFQVRQGKMGACTEPRWPQYVPCMQGDQQKPALKPCTVSKPKKKVSCKVTLVVPAAEPTLVSYSATFTPVAGKPYISEVIEFGLGPQPVYDASGYQLGVPIWFHPNLPLDKMKSIAVLPSPDFLLDGPETGFREFTRLSGDLLARAFVGEKSGGPFAEELWKNRDRVNLWLGGFGASLTTPGFLCAIDFAAPLWPLVAEMDAAFLGHRLDGARECSAIRVASPLQSQRQFTSTVHLTRGDLPEWTLAHELGHSFFGQGDEYCCDGGYDAAPSCKNIYPSRPNCEDLSKAKCDQVSESPGPGLWRGNNGYEGRLETMEVRHPDRSSRASAWGDEARNCLCRYVFPAPANLTSFSAPGSSLSPIESAYLFRVVRSSSPGNPATAEPDSMLQNVPCLEGWRCETLTSTVLITTMPNDPNRGLSSVPYALEGGGTYYLESYLLAVPCGWLPGASAGDCLEPSSPDAKAAFAFYLDPKLAALEQKSSALRNSGIP